MYLSLYITQFFNDIRDQKLRAFLTLFGLVWGTTAIMLLLAVAESRKKHMMKEMAGIGENIVKIWPGWTSKPFKGFDKWRKVIFYPGDVARIKKNVPGILEIGGQANTWGFEKVRYKNKKKAFYLSGVDTWWPALRNIVARKGGRCINDTDMKHKRRNVFIGNKVKAALFNNEDPIGKFIHINSIPFQVVGVMQPKYQASHFKGLDEDRVFIPLSTFMVMFNRNNLNNIVYRPTNIKSCQSTLAAFKHFLGRIKTFDPDDPEALWIWDLTDSNKYIQNFGFGLQVFMGIVGLFTITVAGIGVANIMSVIVEERTREIGIKLALGIKRKIIMLQFLFETFLFTFTGGIIGFVISNSLCKLSFVLELEEMGKPEVTAFVAVSTTIILGATSFLAGYFPARRASQLKPVEALRWQ